MMPTPDSLRALIDEQLFPLDPGVADDADLHAEGLDSMALMQLILLLEAEFGITITPADLGRENFTSLKNLAAFVAGKQSHAT
ncbi:MAG: acyl carrier protein [Luteolibacter sp.]